MELFSIAEGSMSRKRYISAMCARISFYSIGRLLCPQSLLIGSCMTPHMRSFLSHSKKISVLLRFVTQFSHEPHYWMDKH
jgi:hypothetical protein